ncbi:MAG TPA: type II secretion system protein [Geothrix sp.]|uniref:type II secretion system protein n=1 Tax=Geothrix mesophila TaxID=2922723 RepID=UPI001FACB642|nr:type II secretion system protein [Geothrix sp. SG198]HJV37827.1 type II secretion system protein [Geothrix sp.]
MRTASPFRTQRGFTMALALAMAVVMGVMLMKAGPVISAEVQRENEAELIFRGEAIAAALRVYFAKNNRYPTDLDEVMKVRPHILRQKYRDPMTSNGEWEYLTQVQPGASGDTQGLPIVGVRSRSEKDSIHAYQGKTLVRDWMFRADDNLLGGNTTENERTRRSPRGTTPTISKP